MEMHENLSFEEAMRRLDAIVKRLSQAECGLDESLKLFQEANQLSQFCRKKLDESDGKIKEILGQADAERDFEG
ncbi:MAG: exodeoxyribonuclease VII small subunit [Eubacteriales bacterium]|nr:exodeoxyribonuclease VII small subunit [Eubacteriales bacterium]